MSKGKTGPKLQPRIVGEGALTMASHGMGVAAGSVTPNKWKRKRMRVEMKVDMATKSTQPPPWPDHGAATEHRKVSRDRACRLRPTRTRMSKPLTGGHLVMLSSL